MSRRLKGSRLREIEGQKPFLSPQVLNNEVKSSKLIVLVVSRHACRNLKLGLILLFKRRHPIARFNTSKTR